jgi:PadR family transcriptional regulator PadR
MPPAQPRYHSSQTGLRGKFPARLKKLENFFSCLTNAIDSANISINDISYSDNKLGKQMTLPPDTHPNLPLSEQTFYILLSLLPQPRHGYAILKDIQQLSDGRLLISVSTLYTSLKRLLEQGWIERVEIVEQDETSRPRKQYKLTQTGQSILFAETKRLHMLIQAANQRLPQEAI